MYVIRAFEKSSLCHQFSFGGFVVMFAVRSDRVLICFGNERLDEGEKVLNGTKVRVRVRACLELKNREISDARSSFPLRS